MEILVWERDIKDLSPWMFTWFNFCVLYRVLCNSRFLYKRPDDSFNTATVLLWYLTDIIPYILLAHITHNIKFFCSDMMWCVYV